MLDSVRIGEMPGAVEFGDAGRDTLGHVAASRPLKLPHLVKLGLANIKPLAHLTPPERPAGAFGKAALASPGKNTTTGHWEMAGLYIKESFPTYPNGFPPDVMEKFEQAVGRKALGNKTASGTEIIKELGAEHLKTGAPIVYTSADSAFQIAAHEEVIPVEELYRMCQTARAVDAAASSRAGDRASVRGRARPLHAHRAAEATVQGEVGRVVGEDVLVANVAGDLAYSMGTYEYSLKDAEGNPVSDKGKFVDIWKKQANGSWKAAIGIGSSDQPAAE